MAVSQNGFPANANRDAIGIRTYAVPGAPGVKLPVRSDVAPLLLEFARWWHVNVEPLRPGWCWGYAFREIRGGGDLSNHSSGTAIDLNAPIHPLGKVGTVPAGKRAAISAKARALGLRWGGDYGGRKDEMHAEVVVPRARAMELVRALQAPRPSKPAPSVPPKPGGRRTLRVGMRGSDVRTVQAFLKRVYPAYAGDLRPDGEFGPKTRAAVAEFQRRSGLAADGIVGPQTWKALGI